MPSPDGRAGRWSRMLMLLREPLPAARYAPSISGGGAAAAQLLETQPRRGHLHAAIVTIRPHQWIKNALVVGAAGAAGALGRDDVPLRVGLACIAFCLLASGTYAINDVRDAAEDRLHPRKRFRPVAAGELDARFAVALGAALMLTGLALCVAVRPLLGLVGAGYLAVTMSYTIVWRQVVILDILAIACGFVLRAVAGGVAAPVTLSRAFILVVTFSAIFVAAGKRQAELTRSNRAGATPGPSAQVARRRVLRFYTDARLRVILLISAAFALFSYGVWAFELPAVHGVPWRPLTIVPFAICLVRYGTVVRSGRGEAPEELLLRDHWMQFAGLAWLVVFALGVHAAG